MNPTIPSFKKNLDINQNDESQLINLLSNYIKELEEGTISNNQRLLLLELQCKEYLLNNSSALPQSENDFLKYMFLGAYIYAHIETEESFNPLSLKK